MGSSRSGSEWIYHLIDSLAINDYEEKEGQLAVIIKRGENDYEVNINDEILDICFFSECDRYQDRFHEFSSLREAKNFVENKYKHLEGYENYLENKMEEDYQDAELLNFVNYVDIRKTKKELEEDERELKKQINEGLIEEEERMPESERGKISLNLFLDSLIEKPSIDEQAIDLYEKNRKELNNKRDKYRKNFYE